MLSLQSRRQIVKFGIVGVLSTVSHVGTVFVLVELLSIAPQIANLTGFICSVFVSFSGNHFWSFSGHQQVKHIAFAKYLLVVSVGLGYNYIIMRYFLIQLGLPYEYGLFAIILSWPLISFCLAKSWVFAASTDKSKSGEDFGGLGL
mmetsp:Transcript_20425/g.9459  ORF Transcript_20425/g.9459 Transcript_20425/m.9459 type:complete len:146 (+) Transcript_20425:166-603(+)